LIDNFVYRRSKLTMDNEYPKPIRDVFGRWEGGIWQTLPNQIDTALTWPNEQIFFFKVKIIRLNIYSNLIICIG
jgi:hypothetical protein